MLAGELAVDLEEVVLRPLEQEELRRSDLRDLPADLGADAAACAGDEHHPIAKALRDRVSVELDRFAAEQVLDRDRTDACELYAPACDLVEAGDDLHRQADLLGQLR